VVVPVPVVLGVTVSVVDIVEVVAVPHGRVTAAGAVIVRMTAVRDVLARLALVPVPRVLLVEVAVVRVVDVVAVRDLGMSAGRTVGVLVRGVLVVENGHDASPLM
jgi:hypothetical protein